MPCVTLTHSLDVGQTSELESLRTRLRQYDDYDEIKRELEIMKVGDGSLLSSPLVWYTDSWCTQFVEFAGANYDDDDTIEGGDSDVKMPDPNAHKSNQQPAKSLEALVHAKNKRLVEDLTKLRVRCSPCTDASEVSDTFACRYRMARWKLPYKQ